MTDQKKKVDFIKVDLAQNNQERLENPTYLRQVVNGVSIVKWGIDNKYPFTIIDLYNGSSINKAIINKKARHISGVDVKLKDEEHLSVETKALFNYAKFNISYKDTLHQLIVKCAKDQQLYGGFALEVIYNRKGNICQINHIEMHKVRLGDPTENITTHYFLSNDWANVHDIRNKPVMIPAYFPKEGKKDKKQLFVYKEYEVASSFYPKPHWIDKWIMIDKEYTEFVSSNLANSFNPSLWITFVNGVPAEDEKESIKRTLTENYGGANNSGKEVISFVDNPDQKPIIETIETSSALDKIIDNLSQEVRVRIALAHQLPSTIMLAASTNTWSSNQELLTAYKLFENDICKPARGVIEDIFTMLLSKMYDELIQIQIVKMDSVELTFSENVLNNIMTLEEKRNTVPNLKELTDEEKEKLKNNPNN